MTSWLGAGKSIAFFTVRLLATTALWFESRHVSKYQIGYISKGMANTLKTAKKYTQKIIVLASFRRRERAASGDVKT
jgi:hypothetical protein